MFKLPPTITITVNQKTHTYNLRAFWISFLAVFVMVALQQVGIHPPRLVIPIPQKKNVFDAIQLKLEQKSDSYQLKKEQSLIPLAYASDEFNGASAYAVIDYDNGEVILDKNISRPLPIASLTKIMTAIVALDLADPSERFTVSQTAASVVPTRAGLKAGETLTLDELLHAMLITSANDAAEVIKEGIDAKYGREVFIQSMNAKAQFLGLTHTHFMNPQGYDDPNHYSSVEDLARLSHYALTHYPLIDQIVKIDFMRMPADMHHGAFDLINWNGLLDVYPQTTGIKIGNTGDAGKTTIVTSERGGKKLLVVVLGANTIIERDLWASQLLDLGYEKTLGLSPVEVTENQLRAKYSSWYY